MKTDNSLKISEPRAHRIIDMINKKTHLFGNATHESHSVEFVDFHFA